MRKNRMMRAASALMVAVLLTTSTISGTFAKYVTTNEAKDIARVAKWGVELQAEGNLFGENYVNAIAPDAATSAELAVESNDDLLAADADPDDVVAPGTENADGFNFSINGTPEVSGKITTTMEVQNIYLTEGTYGVMVPLDLGVVTAENFDEFECELYTENAGVYTKAAAGDKAKVYYTLEDKVVLTGTYYPVVFTLDGKVTGKDHTQDTLKLVAEAFAAKLNLAEGTLADGVRPYANSADLKFNPNTDLKTLLDLDDEKITWAWAFERELGSGTPEEQAAYTKMYNGADTILGNLIAGNVRVVKSVDANNYKAPTAAAGAALNDYCLNLKFMINITVEQIDEAAGVTP